MTVLACAGANVSRSLAEWGARRPAQLRCKLAAGFDCETRGCCLACDAQSLAARLLRVSSVFHALACAYGNNAGQAWGMVQQRLSRRKG